MYQIPSRIGGQIIASTDGSQMDILRDARVGLN
jgi:hypothetical protein